MPTTQDALESPAKATVPDDHLHAAGRRAYDALAPFYECYWGPAFVDDAVSMFNQFLAPHLPPSAHILDLCCGAGHFAAWAKSAGLQVTGVDVSQSMIGYAREKVSGSEFHVADMKSFRLSSDFSATVCFYNSINQVLTLEALRSTLGTVAQHIQPGGWFLFDVVLEEGMLAPGTRGLLFATSQYVTRRQSPARDRMSSSNVHIRYRRCRRNSTNRVSTTFKYRVPAALVRRMAGLPSWRAAVGSLSGGWSSPLPRRFRFTPRRMRCAFLPKTASPDREPPSHDGG
jgi:SAM-dependent methyltransferase